MKNARILSIPELTRLIASTEPVLFEALDQHEAYVWIEEILSCYGYGQCGKRDKGIIQAYIRKMTGYCSTQTKRLIRQWTQTGRVRRKTYTRHRFPTTYANTDILLLATVDAAHHTLSGPATRLILEREYSVFHKAAFKTLATISVSHIYNLRKTFTYKQKVVVYTKTKPTKVPIGERRKPQPEGKPGSIRVDSVHQGDDPVTGKGVYHLNFIDEVTQWELVACVETISESHLKPVFEDLLMAFPFVVVTFHSDNGSEFINKIVAEILERLRIKQTKSRPRHTNDNALNESKNGAVIRKHMGYHHIPRQYASPINEWYQRWFNTYLNFHRPCAYAQRNVNEKGKEVITYPKENYATPYAKFRSLPDAQNYLQEGVTFEQLDTIAYAMSDTDYAQAMSQAKRAVFEHLKPK